MSPSDASVSAAGARTTSVTTWATVSVAEPETPSASAPIAAVPLPTAVASPDPSTVATEASPLDHAKLCTRSTAWPLASRASAARRTVSISETIVSAGGVTTTSVTTWATVSNAEPDTPSASAAIAAVPLPTAVASPDPSTVATEASPLDHAKLCTRSTAWPLASRASAARRTVSISETIVSAAGVTTTSVTTWATVSVAEPETPSASAAIAAVPLPTAVTSPDPSTVATEGSPLDHAKLCTRSTA